MQAIVFSIREASSHNNILGGAYLIPTFGCTPNRYGISGSSFPLQLFLCRRYSIILAIRSSPVDNPSRLFCLIVTSLQLIFPSMPLFITCYPFGSNLYKNVVTDTVAPSLPPMTWVWFQSPTLKFLRVHYVDKPRNHLQTPRHIRL